MSVSSIMLLISCLSCFLGRLVSYPSVGSTRDQRKTTTSPLSRDCFKLAIRFRHSVIALSSVQSWGRSFCSISLPKSVVWLPLEFPESAFEEVGWIKLWL